MGLCSDAPAYDSGSHGLRSDGLRAGQRLADSLGDAPIRSRSIDDIVEALEARAADIRYRLEQRAGT